MGILDDTSVDEAIAGWSWERDGNQLVLTAKRKDFAGALALVNTIGALAEEANHHPDIDIRWNTVTLRLSTHSEGGITGKDIELARRIAELG